MILALDIAFKNTGWSVLDGGKIIAFGTIKTEKSKKKTVRVSDDKASRAANMATELHEIIVKYDVKGIVGELPSGSQNATAANLLGWAGGVVVGVAAAHGMPCEWISEGDAKKAALGVRSAVKEETMAWARKTFPQVEFPKTICNMEHVADSLQAYHGLRNGILVRTFG